MQSNTPQQSLTRWYISQLLKVIFAGKDGQRLTATAALAVDDMLADYEPINQLEYE